MMRNSTLFTGLAVAIAAAGIAVHNVQADPPGQEGDEGQLVQRGGSPWAQAGRAGGPPPWVIAKMRNGGGSPWGQSRGFGGPPWMQGSACPPWAQARRAGGPPPWVVAKLQSGGGPPWAQPYGFGGPPWMQGRGFGNHQQQRAARFDGIDSDGDGKISKDEVLAMHAKADADGDGAVTKAELLKHIQRVRGGSLKGGRGGAPSAATLFGNFDSNEDGKLSKDEVPAPVWNHLSKADSDDDGVVTKAEFEKVLKSRREELKAKE